MEKSNKKYDARKIYVCAIGFQNRVEEHVTEYYLGNEINYNWDYSGLRLALCEKTLLGYKHILTGKTYRPASHKTEGKLVIKKSPITPWLEYDRRIADVFSKNNFVDFSVSKNTIEKAEQAYNAIFERQKAERGL
ncbi:MAG: hypothetical protein ACLRFE_03550 [Clostridia bacterium]